MKTRSCFSNSDFSYPTVRCHIQQKDGFSRRVKKLVRKIIKRNETVMLSVSAMIFTGTLFLGGSYLFFVQLAEYGW